MSRRKLLSINKPSYRKNTNPALSGTKENRRLKMIVHGNVGNVKAVKSTFQWELNNLSIDTCKNVGDYIESPVFATITDTELRWQLKLYPNGVREDLKDFVSVFLESQNASDVEARFSMYVLSENKQISTFDHASETCVFKYLKGLGQLKFFKKNSIISESNNAAMGELTIICEIYTN